MTGSKKKTVPHIVRTPEMALAEFRYAVDCWFSCMDKPTRQEALRYAHEALDRVEFKPNRVPRAGE